VGNVYEAFSFGDRTLTGKLLADLTIDFCKTMAGATVSQTGMTLTELGVGKYVLMNPNITERTIISGYLTSDSTKSFSVLMDPVDGNIMTLASILEGAETVAESLRIMRAFAAGKSTGGGTLTHNFRDKSDAKNRITATVDGNGNRTAVVVDGA
jgi:hypothetical protein